MNNNEFIVALKDMDNDTLMDNLEDLGGDGYYQELRFAILAEIRKRLAISEREKGTLEKIKSEIEKKCDRINSIASILSYPRHREIQELLCEILDNIGKADMRGEI